jgi:hypothetical protein
MYLAFRYPRSAGTTNQFSVQFSNDNSGVLKNGDDMLRQIPQTGFFDEVLTNQSSECSPNTPPGGCLAEDTDGRLLGTKDGQGAFRANPPAGVPDDGFATYEIAHPLSSGDASDFALSIGQATGFIGSLQIGPTVTTFPATDATFPPGAQNYGRIVVHDLPQFGFVTDPKGDAIGGTTPRPDLLSANAAFTGTSLVMNVHFASNTYNPQATITQFLLDTDQNPATGNPGSDSSGVTDAGIIGVDYFVQVNPDGTATLFKYAGSVNSYSVVPNVTPIVVALSDGFQVTVPLAAIGNPFNVNFKVVDASQIGAGTFTGVQDYMPDVGKPAGSTGTTIL